MKRSRSQPSSYDRLDSDLVKSGGVGLVVTIDPRSHLKIKNYPPPPITAFSDRLAGGRGFCFGFDGSIDDNFRSMIISAGGVCGFGGMVS